MTSTESLTYTVDQVAALLGIAHGVAYESVRHGEIPATRVGGGGSFRVEVPRLARRRGGPDSREEGRSLMADIDDRWHRQPGRRRPPPALHTYRYYGHLLPDRMDDLADRMDSAACAPDAPQDGDGDGKAPEAPR